MDSVSIFTGAWAVQLLLVGFQLFKAFIVKINAILSPRPTCLIKLGCLW